MNDLPDLAPETKPEPGCAFFVSCRDAGRTGILAGPYGTFGEAKARVEVIRRKAAEANPWAHFYAFGVCQAHDGAKAVFGKVA